MSESMGELFAEKVLKDEIASLNRFVLQLQREIREKNFVIDDLKEDKKILMLALEKVCSD